MLDQFLLKGFVGPVKVLDQEQCLQLALRFRQRDFPQIPDWTKAMAVHVPEIYGIAVQPNILHYVKEILGENVMLWGATIIRRVPGQMHPWHNDIESSVISGKTVSVWIGLKNTSQSSALQMISGSHTFMESIQEVRFKKGVSREKATADQALKWAHELNRDCSLIVPEMEDGEALIFDGWLWHASHNTGTQARLALLLQYATPDTVIHIPDQNHLEWPFKVLQYPKPPYIMVSGSDYFRVNKIVPAPVPHNANEKYLLTNLIYPIDVPLTPGSDKAWKPFPIFRGSTPNLQSITCHVSALKPESTPHPPHQHKEEEILILLHGEADVTLPDLTKEGQSEIVTLRPGEFVYYPAWFSHTITAKGDSPANYLMFKWYNAKEDKLIPENGAAQFAAAELAEKLRYGKFTIAQDIPLEKGERKYYTKRVFRNPTDCLFRLQSHVSMMLPGGGYPAHTDAHDVAIVTWKGELESLETPVHPFSVMFFPAGQPHDMKNTKNSDAQYLVFEFHGNHPRSVAEKKSIPQPEIRDPKGWKHLWSKIKARF